MPANRRRKGWTPALVVVLGVVAVAIAVFLAILPGLRSSGADVHFEDANLSIVGGSNLVSNTLRITTFGEQNRAGARR